MAAPGSQPELRRALGWGDTASLTFGSVVGTGIFLTAGDVARALPHPLLILAAWIAGGLLVLAGALAYAELGAAYPRAGGLYCFLREAWGPAWGFLYGWSCLLVIMSGGIAAIAVGFAEYFGAVVPALSRDHVLVAAGGCTFHGTHVVALLAILLLTATNHFGVRAGALVQNLFTLAKLAVIALLVAGALVSEAPPSRPPHTPPLAMLAPIGLAMIATLWTYDGWYAPTFAAGEIRDPERNLPRGLLLGVVAVIVTYLLLNLAYLRALPVEALARSPRAAEAAAAALFGAAAGRSVSAAVSISAFGCLAATILYAARIYQPMAADRVFFQRVAAIHPRWRTPVAALWLQGAWAAVLALSGSYTQLFTYVTFAGLLFHVAGGLALFRLRAVRPHEPRPYQTWGYPLVPALFVAGMVALTLGTLLAAPRESLVGTAAIAAGLPIYRAWRRKAPEPPAGEGRG